MHKQLFSLGSYSLISSDSAMFDGTQLQWDIPQIIPPLVGDGAKFESQNFSLGVEGFLLDESTVASRGLSLLQQGGMVKIRVPFGAEGGYTKVHPVCCGG